MPRPARSAATSGPSSPRTWCTAATPPSPPSGSSSSSSARPYSVARIPRVERIRRPLLVPTAVGLLHEPEPVSLVEAPGRDVLLEDPQPEPRGHRLLRAFEQRAADALPEVIRPHVEVFHHIHMHRDEADDLAVR